MTKKIIKLTEEELTKLVESILEEGRRLNYQTDNQKHFGKNDSQNDVIGFGDAKECEPLTYDYLMSRHEDLPEEYFKQTNIPYDPNERAIYNLPLTYNENNHLEEGLIKTYPTPKAIEHVCDMLSEKGYPITPNQFSVDTPNDDKTIYGHILLMVYLNYLNKEIDDILKQGFDICGYHLGTTFNRIDRYGNQCLVYQFEPKFQTNHTNLTLGRYLFHITTANAAKKILRQGLCPSNRTKKHFKYNARCYFFTVYNKRLFANYMQESMKQNDNGKNPTNNDFKIIIVDRNKCNNTIFFTDPNFDKQIAVFTYNNIPPSAIIRCEDL